MALLPEEEYVESGYLLDDDYVGGIAEGAGIFEPYVEEDYIETGYFQESGMIFAIVINTDGIVQEGAATLTASSSVVSTVGKLQSAEANITGAFNTVMTVVAKLAGDATLETVISIEITASRTRSGESSLEWFANLDAQADRFRDIGADFSSYFWMSDSSHNFGTNVDVDATFEGASTLVSTADLVAEAWNVQFGDADLSSSVDTSANAIEYISRFTNSNRPYTMQVYDNSDVLTIPSATTWQYRSNLKVYNSYSLQMIGTDYTMRTDNSIDFASDDFAIEWWQYTTGGFSTGDYLFRMVYTDSLGQGEIIDLRYYDSGNQYLRLGAREDTDSGSSNNDSPDLGANLTGWHHYAIVKDSNHIGLILDGTLVISRSFTSTGITANSATPTWYAENKSPHYDGMHIQSGSATPNSYSAEPQETEYTLGIWDFETSTSGGAGGALTFEGASAASSVASLTSSLSGIQNASANLQIEGFVVTAVGKVSDFFVNADITSTVVAEPEKTVGFSAAISSVADWSVSEDLFKSFDADLPGVFTISNLVGAVRSAEMSSVISMNVDVAPGYVAESTVITSVTSAVTATGGIIKSAFSSMASAFSTVPNGGLTAVADSSLSAIFEQTSTETRIRSAVSNFEAVATASTAVNYTGDALLTAGWVADLTATSETFPAGSALLQSAFDFSVLSTSTAPAESSISAETSFSVQGTKTTRYEAVLDSAFGLNTVTNSTAPASAEISTAFQFTVDESLFKANSVLMSTDFALQVSGDRSRDTQSTVIATASVVGSGDVDYSGSADLTGFYTTLTIAKTLQVNQYVYTIPAETREYTIPNETRAWSITSENRSYTIEG